MKAAWKVPEGIDAECVEICQALNQSQGVRTVESCCGHGEQPFRIWFKVTRLSDLPYVLWHFDRCHCGFYGWRVIAKTDCGMSPVSFMIEGPIGQQAYEEASKIAAIIRESLS
jgi:hypothetical protein